ncbi:MAG: phosphoadenylyl-sulfate reductase [Actinomyces sp.]|uniref:phosphoadenylyl-sulfate reductase n=1 Tax=Actinomyces sp. TaxID=29317 RepID=UPI0026DD19C5|nr:phosphoadenylyl-sulfate reductase [Actinomyces sp.]MDO4243696.1 phosphoadenylyl-sulfate reductase [Actinomyces sp.]
MTHQTPVRPQEGRIAPEAPGARFPEAPRSLRPAEELQSVVEEAVGRLGGLGDEDSEASADEVMAWAAAAFPGTLAVACSMADAVLPHLVARHVPGVDVLFLDTGYHFAETYGTRDAVAASLDVRVVDVLPALTVEEQDAAWGPRLYERDPTRCCALRKVEPLQRALTGYEAWVTGVRREDASTRTHTPLVSWDASRGLVKINPLAAWTLDDLLAYAEEHHVVVNPLLADGYPSIGCQPCTRRVAPGEDPRSGRWAGFAKTECGIHL